MSFTSYPIITQGSNIDILRQGHNLLTTNIGDMNGLQTPARETVVDAVNSLYSAFSALTVSAYPPLNNEQWLTATIFSGFGTLNLFKLSSTNEFVIAQHMIPLGGLLDLGKAGTAWRAGHITTLNTTKIQAVTNLEIASTTTLTFTLSATQVSLVQSSPTLMSLQTSGVAGLDLRSRQTRLFSGSNLFDLTEAGHWEPGVTQTQNVGSAAKEINRVFTKNITASGDVTFNADVIMPNAGAAMPIGGGCLWFLPTIPNNYLVADGSAVSRTTYAALFAIMGTYYGIGNGSTTFNLPDMRNRIPHGVHPAQVSPDASQPGRTFGTINHTHNATMPRHFHYNSGGQVIPNHENQVTGAPSVLPSAGFSGNQLPVHGHGINDFGHGHNISDPGHSHGVIDPGHGHNMSDPGHIHGAGLPTHSHPLNTGIRNGQDVATDTGPKWATPANYGSAQIGLFTGLADGDVFSYGSGDLGVGVGAASVVAQGLSVVFGSSNITNTHSSGINITRTLDSGTGISIQANTAGTPSGTVSLSNTSHSHTIPTLTHTISGWIGNGTGSNGDVDNTLVSTVNNPPSFAVHYIIRAK